VYDGLHVFAHGQLGSHAKPGGVVLLALAEIEVIEVIKVEVNCQLHVATVSVKVIPLAAHAD
jgi:hypothetical protein